MKDLMRQRVGVQENIMSLLNKQIKMEAQASATYLAMAAWCEQNSFDNSAAFFYAQSNEERDHMLKIFHYVSEVGGVAVSPEISAPKSEYGSLREVFETTLEHEIAVTESIHQIVGACRKANDYAAENFLQWFVKEQVEEELTVKRILDYFEMLGEEPMALLMIDERVAKVSANGAY
ncbi:ferritin [Reichenbachiella versicolor]|uniref:ferritin n=1 Tax=Reichenbachiella versicolor TaxID=1821036 RepID=UPI000D6E8C97|nr:ferritin [Reichenbachiella versicolor]